MDGIIFLITGRVLEGSIRWALGKPCRMCVEAPAHVDASIYRKGKDYVIHLVNLAGTRVPPGTLEENLPIESVRVKLCVDGKDHIRLRECSGQSLRI